MRSTEFAHFVIAVVASAVLPFRAVRAQEAASGFAVERLRLSPPGSDWLVMDGMDWPASLGGSASLSLGYAHRPLVAGGLAVVEHQAFFDVGLAVAHDRFRLDAHFASPMYVAGQSGVAAGASFVAPVANVEQNPDTIADGQIGLTYRILGRAAAPLRLGARAQLIFPSADRSDYLTDGTYRGTGTVLVAGEGRRFGYAAHTGVHLRPLDTGLPEHPRGSELLFGAAGGAKLDLGGTALLLGPEIHGATAFRSFFASGTTAIEGLLTASVKDRTSASSELAVKIGAGAGLHPHFGAPRWRTVVGIELRGVLERTSDSRHLKGL